MRALSEPAGASRVTGAEALGGVTGFVLPDLGRSAVAPRTLDRRDLSNETARAAYELGRNRGLAQGLREGELRGYEAGAQALAGQLSLAAQHAAAQMLSLVAGFREGLAATEARVAEELMSLAVDIARQVIRQELAADPQALLPAAREALRAIGEGAQRLELHAHPLDAAVLREHLDAGSGAPAFVLVEDPSITPGGCRVEADTGVADATLEGRWSAVMDRLGRPLEHAP